MKTKLLKKLRNIGRNQINIYSVTTNSYGTIGMHYGCNDEAYLGLYNLGDTEKDVRDKAMKIYLENNLEYFRKKYRRQ